MKFNRRLNSAAVEPPVKCKGRQATVISNLATPRFYEIWESLASVEWKMALLLLAYLAIFLHTKYELCCQNKW